MGLEQIKVEYNHHDGDDLAVVNAARKSFAKKSEWDWADCGGVRLSESKGCTSCNEYRGPGVGCFFPRTALKPADEKLIQFLARGISSDDYDKLLHQASDQPAPHLEDTLWEWRHTPIHDTPFNHCHISFDIKAPIFVARQLVKTEYAPFSEFSGRYIILDEFYDHDYREQAKDRKQGSLDTLHPKSTHWKSAAHQAKKEAFALYREMIEDGVAIEQARGVLPLDTMTAWTWSATLGAFAKMCRERLSPHAQMETRYVAMLVYEHLKAHFPVSAPALVEGPRKWTLETSKGTN